MRSSSAANCRLLPSKYVIWISLPSDAGKLIQMKYFEGKSLQLAADELRISRSWASRLHQKTLSRLATAMRALGVDDPF